MRQHKITHKLRVLQRLNAEAKRNDYGGGVPLAFSTEACKEMNICEECYGDLGATAKRSVEGVLGKYSPCRCRELPEAWKPTKVVAGAVLPGNTTYTIKEYVPVPTTNTDLEVLKKPFESQATELRRNAAELEAMPLGLQKARVAHEFATKAEAYLKMIETSELTEQIRKSYGTHKFLVKMKQVLTDPGEYLRRYCALVATAYERDRAAKIAAEQRAREAEAMAKAQAERDAEVEHLEKMGWVEEAAEKKFEPIEPVAIPEEKNPPGKSAWSLTKVWKAEGISNEREFYHWLAENEAYWPGLALLDVFWKRILTANKGTLKVPGLRVIEGEEARHRG